MLLTCGLTHLDYVSHLFDSLDFLYICVLNILTQLTLSQLHQPLLPTQIQLE